MLDTFDVYLAEIVRIDQAENTTEHTFCPALKTLIEQFVPTVF